jgi:hypothetical protein
LRKSPAVSNWTEELLTELDRQRGYLAGIIRHLTSTPHSPAFGLAATALCFAPPLKAEIAPVCH